MKSCCKGQDRVLRKTDDLEIVFQWFRANMARGVVKYVNICHCSSDKTVRGECLKQRLLLVTLIKNISNKFCMCSIRNLLPSPSVNWAAVQVSHIVQWQNWIDPTSLESLLSLIFHHLQLWAKKKTKKTNGLRLNTCLHSHILPSIFQMCWILIFKYKSLLSSARHFEHFLFGSWFNIGFLAKSILCFQFNLNENLLDSNSHFLLLQHIVFFMYFWHVYTHLSSNYLVYSEYLHNIVNKGKRF